MKFSQRIGKTEATKSMQIESIDTSLKNRLWNGVKLFFIDPILSDNYNLNQFKYFESFCKILWKDFFIMPIDTVPQTQATKESTLREWFYKTQWHQIYDFMEFIANMEFEYTDMDRVIDKDDYIEYCNVSFEKEFSGYRFVSGQISPITNDLEIMEIEIAISETKNFTPAKGANIHLSNALDKLSDKLNPDYRNSIKESISAIESVAKSISKGSNDSLGGALDKIKGKIKIHQALERGFKQLYGYTSDAGGIRHALMDNSICDFEDAKFMLVSSSAFINYLLIKAEKANI